MADTTCPICGEACKVLLPETAGNHAFACVVHHDFEVTRAATGTTTIASVDATAEQQAQWAREFIRMLLWTEGTRCRKCGHVATGPLTECTPEDVKRWREREVEVA
jgi:hypothetical protein